MKASVSKFFKIFGKKSKAAGRLTKKWWNMITKKNRKQQVKTENPEEIDPTEKRKRELREKINKPLSRIHRPVKVYDARVTRSVQRMFNNLKTNNPLWRANWYLYQDPELFSPLSEKFSHTSNKEFFDGNFWVRVERQTLMRLPETKSIVFGIHTYVVQKQDLLENQVTSLKQFSTKNNT